MERSLGVYISVPFCKAKCSYCNFASGVFGSGPEGALRMQRYVERLCAEIHAARARAVPIAAELPSRVDSLYFGGGTPSLLSAPQMQQIFTALRGEFDLISDAEVTIECAPGQLADASFDELLRLGMNRVSFGVQSFVDAEARAVGRSHTRESCLAEIARMRAAGIAEINVDLIAGLPRQTAESWRESLDVALASELPHISVYMLEVDDDSRLGRELLAKGKKYGAQTVASDDETADRYSEACARLESSGVHQYEISNFARRNPDHRSRHNIKYWRREPYLGFGLDAHSMLRCGDEALRWANTDALESYLADSAAVEIERIGRERGFEEAIFLGMRMNAGIDLAELAAEFGEALTQRALEALQDVEEAGLVARVFGRVSLTANGRMASNEVFSRLLVGDRSALC
jgi:oxygen-independent coproporphyrinogen-3 oxidase